MVTPPLPLHLCTSGVAGLIGGDEAVLALAAVHVYESRRWLGWYNSPGSYQIAKRLGLLTKSRIPDDSSSGVHAYLTKLLKLDITKGPKFRATQSGTVMEDTSHVASLFMKECASRKGKAVGERITAVVGVTVVELKYVPKPHINLERIKHYTPIFACIPIAVSLASCVACGVFEDWCAFSLILLGIIANGISSLVIGSGELHFSHPDPAQGSPRGDGILGSGKQIVLLKGEEGAVNSITRGHFSLKFSDEDQFGRIGWCSTLLDIQFIAQLFLIPQASPFGQILFVASLTVSWIYNSWMASCKDKDKIQRDILFNDVLQVKESDLKKYALGTFTSVVIFSLLVLRPEDPNRFLDGLLPNNTEVWRRWKETIRERFREDEEFEFSVADRNLDGLGGGDQKLLNKLYDDAQEAYGEYATLSN